MQRNAERPSLLGQRGAHGGAPGCHEAKARRSTRAGSRQLADPCREQLRHQNRCRRPVARESRSDALRLAAGDSRRKRRVEFNTRTNEDRHTDRADRLQQQRQWEHRQVDVRFRRVGCLRQHGCGLLDLAELEPHALGAPGAAGGVDDLAAAGRGVRELRAPRKRDRNDRRAQLQCRLTPLRGRDDLGGATVCEDVTLLFGAEEGRDGDDDLSREPAGELGDGPFDTVLADQTESAAASPAARRRRLQPAPRDPRASVSLGRRRSRSRRRRGRRCDSLRP